MAGSEGSVGHALIFLMSSSFMELRSSPHCPPIVLLKYRPTLDVTFCAPARTSKLLDRRVGSAHRNVREDGGGAHPYSARTLIPATFLSSSVRSRALAPQP